jgi:hypothetical protein
LAFTTVALAATRALGFSSLAPELCALTAANVAAALIRFGILRTWVFRPQFGTHLSPDTNSSEIPPPAGSSTTLARRQS